MSEVRAVVVFEILFQGTGSGTACIYVQSHMNRTSSYIYFSLEQMQMNLGAAEATILSLSQAPQPYQTCKFILGKSKTFSACRA